MALGEAWVSQPIVGHWTPTGFPQRVVAAGRLFERARWQQPYPGVVEQYREVRPGNSAHLMVHADRTWRIDHIDEDNPDRGRVIEHGLNDTTVGKMIKAAAIGGAALGGGYLLGRGLAALFGGGARPKPRRRRRS
jgi:hypothetical protein